MQLTKQQGIIVTGFTGKLACDFGNFHQAAEKKLGHPIFTHQFADPEIVKKLQEAFSEDFIAMGNEGKATPLEEAQQAILDAYELGDDNDILMASGRLVDLLKEQRKL